MTEVEYKRLQVWCQSNKKRSNYNLNVELRKRATALRRDINCFKQQIKQDMFVLEACKGEKTINKWKKIIDFHKQERDKAMAEFNKLPTPLL